MSTRDPLVRNISDTALLAAIYRARETERPDAVFRDPFARRLAGERGDRIAKSMPFSERATWAWITRTHAYDKFTTSLSSLDRRYRVAWLAEDGQEGMGEQIREGKAEFQFAPEEGPAFFNEYGWDVVEVRSTLKTAARLKRLSFWMRLLSFWPDSQGKQGSRPWSGICLLGNQSAAQTRA
jgi:O-methyltransferase involved in polyketide biosynthesis